MTRHRYNPNLKKDVDLHDPLNSFGHATNRSIMIRRGTKQQRRPPTSSMIMAPGNSTARSRQTTTTAAEPNSKKHIASTTSPQQKTNSRNGDIFKLNNGNNMVIMVTTPTASGGASTSSCFSSLSSTSRKRISSPGVLVPSRTRTLNSSTSQRPITAPPTAGTTTPRIISPQCSSKGRSSSKQKTTPTSVTKFPHQNVSTTPPTNKVIGRSSSSIKGTPTSVMDYPPHHVSSSTASVEMIVEKQKQHQGSNINKRQISNNRQQKQVALQQNTKHRDQTPSPVLVTNKKSSSLSCSRASSSYNDSNDDNDSGDRNDDEEEDDDDDDSSIEGPPLVILKSLIDRDTSTPSDKKKKENHDNHQPTTSSGSSSRKDDNVKQKTNDQESRRKPFETIKSDNHESSVAVNDDDKNSSNNTKHPKTNDVVTGTSSGRGGIQSTSSMLGLSSFVSSSWEWFQYMQDNNNEKEHNINNAVADNGKNDNPTQTTTTSITKEVICDKSSSNKTLNANEKLVPIGTTRLQSSPIHQQQIQLSSSSSSSSSSTGSNFFSNIEQVYHTSGSFIQPVTLPIVPKPKNAENDDNDSDNDSDSDNDTADSNIIRNNATTKNNDILRSVFTREEEDVSHCRTPRTIQIKNSSIELMMEEQDESHDNAVTQPSRKKQETNRSTTAALFTSPWLSLWTSTQQDTATATATPPSASTSTSSTNQPFAIATHEDIQQRQATEDEVSDMEDGIEIDDLADLKIFQTPETVLINEGTHQRNHQLLTMFSKSRYKKKRETSNNNEHCMIQLQQEHFLKNEPQQQESPNNEEEMLLLDQKRTNEKHVKDSSSSNISHPCGSKQQGQHTDTTTPIFRASSSQNTQDETYATNESIAEGIEMNSPTLEHKTITRQSISKKGTSIRSFFNKTKKNRFGLSRSGSSSKSMLSNHEEVIVETPSSGSSIRSNSDRNKSIVATISFSANQSKDWSNKLQHVIKELPAATTTATCAAAAAVATHSSVMNDRNNNGIRDAINYHNKHAKTDEPIHDERSIPEDHDCTKYEHHYDVSPSSRCTIQDDDREVNESSHCDNKVTLPSPGVGRVISASESASSSNNNNNEETKTTATATAILTKCQSQSESFPIKHHHDKSAQYDTAKNPSNNTTTAVRRDKESFAVKTEPINISRTDNKEQSSKNHIKTTSSFVKSSSGVTTGTAGHQEEITLEDHFKRNGVTSRQRRSFFCHDASSMMSDSSSHHGGGASIFSNASAASSFASSCSSCSSVGSNSTSDDDSFVTEMSASHRRREKLLEQIKHEQQDNDWMDQISNALVKTNFLNKFLPTCGSVSGGDGTSTT